jgi:DNA-binding CsgD family transcriptional regulator
MTTWQLSAREVGIMEKLTKRQRQIVRLLASGDSQQEIARKLGLRYGTVRQHMQAARKRGECRSTIEVVFKAASEL